MKYTKTLLYAFTLSTLGNSLAAGRVLLTLYNSRQLLSAAIPLVYTALDTYTYLRDYKDHPEQEKRLREPSPQALAWCQQHIARCTSEKVKIKVGVDQFKPTGIYRDTIIIHPQQAALLEKSCGEGFETLSIVEAQAVQQMAFTLYHEIAHIRNNDEQPTHKLLPVFGAVLGVELVSQGIATLLPTTPFPHTKTTVVKFLVKQIALGVGKLWTVRGLLRLHNQYKETRADNFACARIQDPQVLWGAAACFRREAGYQLVQVLSPEYNKKGELDYAKMTETFKELPGWSQKCIIYCAWFKSDLNHPMPTFRSLKLKKRAKELEAVQPQIG